MTEGTGSQRRSRATERRISLFLCSSVCDPVSSVPSVISASAYDAYFRATVVPELNAIAGFEGSTLLQRPNGEIVEVTVLTWWTSLDAVRAFAGEAIDTAVVHDRAARMLIDFDTVVHHHDVVFNEPGTNS